MPDDVTELLLGLAKAQFNTVELRDDEYIHKIKKVNETIKLVDTVETTTATHPAKWGAPRKWGRCTWG